MPHRQRSNLIRWLKRSVIVAVTMVLLVSVAAPLASSLSVNMGLVTTTRVRAKTPPSKSSSSSKSNSKGGKTGNNTKGANGKNAKSQNSNNNNSGSGGQSSSGGGTGSEGGEDPLEQVAEKVTDAENTAEQSYTKAFGFGNNSVTGQALHGNLIQAGKNLFNDDKKSVQDVKGDLSGGSQAQKQADKSYGITPLSNPGNQWSGLGGKNGFLGIATKSSSTTDYSTLTSRPITKNEGEAAEFGGVLYLEGFDHSNQSSIGADPFKRLGRYLGGAILFIGELINLFDYWLMKHLMNLFDLFNPLAWISRDSSMGGNVAFAPIVGRFRSWLHAAALVGITFVTVSIGYTLMIGMIKWFHGQAPHQAFMGVFRSYRRLFGILVVNLLVVAAFGFALNWLSGVFDQDGDSASEFAIYSTLIDNRDWIQHSRMALPTNVNNVLPFGEKRWNSSELPPPTHEMALSINGDGAGIPNARIAEDADGARLDGGSSNSTKGGGYYNTNTNGQGYDPTTLKLVRDWFSDSGYTAPDWSSYVKAHLPQKIAAGNSQAAAHHLGAKHPYYLSSILQNDPNHDTIGPPSHQQWPYINNGTLDVSSTHRFISQPPASAGSGEATNSTHGGDLSPAAYGGLSTIGMYNYLLTTFTDSDMTWTKGDNLMNSVSRPEHKNVGMTGTGVSSFCNFVLMASMLISVAVLGLGILAYDIWTLFANTPRVIGYDFGNNLGIWSMTARLVATAASIIITLVITSMIYVAGRDVLISLSIMPDQIFGPTAYNHKYVPSQSDQLITHVLNAFNIHSSAIQAGAGSSFLYEASCAGMGFLLMYVAYVLLRAWKPIKVAFDHWSYGIIRQIFNHHSNSTSVIHQSNHQNANNHANVNGGRVSALTNTRGNNAGNGIFGGHGNGRNSAGLQGGNNTGSYNAGDKRDQELKNYSNQAHGDNNNKNEDTNKGPNSQNSNKGGIHNPSSRGGVNNPSSRGGINNPGNRSGVQNGGVSMNTNKNGKGDTVNHGLNRSGGIRNGSTPGGVKHGDTNTHAQNGGTNVSHNSPFNSKGLNATNTENAKQVPTQMPDGGLNTESNNPYNSNLSTRDNVSPTEAHHYADMARKLSNGRESGLNPEGENQSVTNNGDTRSNSSHGLNRGNGAQTNSQDMASRENQVRHNLAQSGYHANRDGSMTKTSPNGGVQNVSPQDIQDAATEGVNGTEGTNGANSANNYGLNTQGQNAPGHNVANNRNGISYGNQAHGLSHGNRSRGLHNQNNIHGNRVQNGRHSMVHGLNRQGVNNQVGHHSLSRGLNHEGVNSRMTNKMNPNDVNPATAGADGLDNVVRTGGNRTGLNQDVSNNPNTNAKTTGLNRNGLNQDVSGQQTATSNPKASTIQNGLNRNGLNQGVSQQASSVRQGGAQNVQNQTSKTGTVHGSRQPGLNRAGLNPGSRTGNVPSMHSAHQGLQTAMSKQRSARMAYHRVSGLGPNASPEEQSMVKQRLHSANNGLRRARLGVTRAYGHQRVQPSMMRSDFRGPRPTVGQTRSALQHVSTARRNLMHSYHGKATPQAKSAAHSYVQAAGHARSLGLAPSTWSRGAAGKTVHNMDSDLGKQLSIGRGNTARMPIGDNGLNTPTGAKADIGSSPSPVTDSTPPTNDTDTAPVNVGAGDSGPSGTIGNSLDRGEGLNSPLTTRSTTVGRGPTHGLNTNS